MTEWPNNGVEFNRWYSGITRFIQVLKHFQWIRASEFKYVNIRIDTRNGNFILLSEEKDGQRRRVDPNEIAQHVDMDKVDGADETAKVSEIIKPYRGMINDTPDLMSLLYDIDMLPEQCRTVIGAIRLAALCEVWKRCPTNKT